MPGTSERLGGMAAIASKAECLIVVDHHSLGSDGFGHLRIIDPQAAASAELAFLLIEAAGWKIDERIATSLLTGLVTDTGRFQYSNTSPATLRLAADLVAAGADRRSSASTSTKKLRRLPGGGGGSHGESSARAGGRLGLVGDAHGGPVRGGDRPGRHRSSDRPGPTYRSRPERLCC